MKNKIPEQVKTGYLAYTVEIEQQLGDFHLISVCRIRHNLLFLHE